MPHAQGGPPATPPLALGHGRATPSRGSQLGWKCGCFPMSESLRQSGAGHVSGPHSVSPGHVVRDSKSPLEGGATRRPNVKISGLLPACAPLRECGERLGDHTVHRFGWRAFSERTVCDLAGQNPSASMRSGWYVCPRHIDDGPALRGAPWTASSYGMGP